MKKWIVILASISVIITGIFLANLLRSKAPATTNSSDAIDSQANSAATHMPPTAMTPPSTKASESNLAKAIRAEGEKMNHLSANPEKDEQELEALAARLQSKNGKELVAIALDQSRHKNDRFLAVYLMGKRAGDFIPELAAIAASKNALLASEPDPHTADLIAKNFEVSQRIEALKGLDSVVKEKGQELAAIFQNIQTQSPSITVRQIARIGYVGAMRGDPLVKTYIDSKLQAVVK